MPGWLWSLMGSSTLRYQLFFAADEKAYKGGRFHGFSHTAVQTRGSEAWVWGVPSLSTSSSATSATQPPPPSLSTQSPKRFVQRGSRRRIKDDLRTHKRGYTRELVQRSKMGLSGCVTGNNCPARYQVSHPSGGLKKGNFNGSSSVCGNLATYRTAKHRERYTSLWSFTSQLSTSQIVSQQSQLVEDRSASSRENLEREREKIEA